jgi:transposase
MTTSYPTDITDDQWELLQTLLPPAKANGRPRTTDLRVVINAIFYILVSGAAWRMLPHDYDGGKKVKGRKRHLMVDTLGLVIIVVVTAADVSDQQGARLIFERLLAWKQRMKRMVRIWVDGTYDGVAFMRWTMDTYHWILETIKRSDHTKGFVLLPKRWVVERTWGWLNWCRRLGTS